MGNSMLEPGPVNKIDVTKGSKIDEPTEELTTRDLQITNNSFKKKGKRINKISPSTF